MVYKCMCWHHVWAKHNAATMHELLTRLYGWLSFGRYIKAKSKKYSNLVSIERPTTRLLCEIFFTKAPQKICGLRPDSLAGILLKANVRPGARVMVAETCQGKQTTPFATHPLQRTRVRVQPQRPVYVTSTHTSVSQALLWGCM